jgi:hypothetical protein
MPYINKHDRYDLKENLRDPMTAGELNFLITTIIKQYYENRPCYQRINDVVGALEGAKLEFYRRVAAPYEDTKIEENGDVY